MGESLKAQDLSDQEIEKYGKFTSEEIAEIVNASLLLDPENAEAVRSFINQVHLKEQFMLLLIKSIQPQTAAFYENIIGICETRIKETGEN